VFGYATLCRWASISDVSKDLRALIVSVKKAARLTLLRSFDTSGTTRPSSQIRGHASSATRL
jgi:hypothetical protein